MVQAGSGSSESSFEETLRPRIDWYAEVFAHHVEESSTELLDKTEVPVTALSTGHVALDLDVFWLDHSGTKKEGVLRMNQGEDGDAPIRLSKHWGPPGL